VFVGVPVHLYWTGCQYICIGRGASTFVLNGVLVHLYWQIKAQKSLMYLNYRVPCLVCLIIKTNFQEIALIILQLIDTHKTGWTIVASSFCNINLVFKSKSMILLRISRYFR